ncbi:MAG: hypothetical protein AB1295_04775 [Candidatus Micrarchaeota archaeon]
MRHLMYLGSNILYLATPIALDSYVALLPFLLYPAIICFRIIGDIAHEGPFHPERAPGGEHSARMTWRAVDAPIKELWVESKRRCTRLRRPT